MRHKKELLFKVRVRGIAINNKKILLVKENGGNWETPGGIVEDEEKFEDALKREMLEETGYDIGVGNIIFITYKKFSQKTCNLHIFYKILLKSKISEPEKDIEGIKWFDIKELKKLIDKNEVDYHDIDFFNYAINKRLL
ncbi:MAG: NUDIX hydrolase [Candidatus Aenigmatarchaeota archaeon]